MSQPDHEDDEAKRRQKLVREEQQNNLRDKVILPSTEALTNPCRPTIEYRLIRVTLLLLPLRVCVCVLLSCCLGPFLSRVGNEASNGIFIQEARGPLLPHDRRDLETDRGRTPWGETIQSYWFVIPSWHQNYGGNVGKALY